MGKGWRKARQALGFATCTVSAPFENDDFEPSVSVAHQNSNSPPSSAHVVDLQSKSNQSSSNNLCAICLESIANGMALFTAECSHTFHFQCIASSGHHGNILCPVCRAQWKDVPWHQPKLPTAPSRNQALRHAREEQRRLDPVLRILDHSIAGYRENRLHEHSVYEDDEPIDPVAEEETSHHVDESQKIHLSIFPEYEVLKKEVAKENFAALISVKAGEQRSRRAPIDLVTVLDISGSMSGKKLILLKRAMGFLISNLSAQDRLSVVTFSGTSKRLFPLSRMSAEAQSSATGTVNRQRARGGTNITDGLNKAAKVMNSRLFRNPVSAIMLLSDGQDTCDFNADTASSMTTPVHTFGFGNDHDAATLHLIAERSGGTFSYLQDENLVQEAFAQCIGGLLTVIVQDLQVTVTTCETHTKIKAVHAGSYSSIISENGNECTVKLGDLYAEESRDILLDLNVPASSATSDASVELISVSYKYTNPVSATHFESGPQHLSVRVVADDSVTVKNAEVKTQQKRVRISDAIAEAKNLAESGDMSGAQTVLENAKGNLCSESDSALGRAVEAEIKEIQERMKSSEVYEEHGRAFVLSAISSYSRQRATTRGQNSEEHTMYQTPSMSFMVGRSHGAP